MNVSNSDGARRDAPTAGIGLTDLIALVSRRIWLVVTCLVLGLLLGAGYCYVVTPKFESMAQFMVMKKDSKLPIRGMEGVSHEASVSEDLLATHIQIIQSRQIVQQALQRNGYDKLPSIVNRLKRDQDPVDFVQQRMRVTRGGTGQSKSARVLNVAFQHVSAEESRQILEAIVQTYQEFVSDKLQEVGKEATVLIQRAKDELGAAVAQSEKQYQEFREKAPLLLKGDQSTNIHLVRYEELEAELSKIRLRASETRSRLEVVRGALDSQDESAVSDLQRLALLDSERIERLATLVNTSKGDANSAEFQAMQPARTEGARAEHDSLLRLLMKEKTLKTDLGPDHPQVQDVNRQIAMINDFLQKKSAVSGGLETKASATPTELVHAYVELLDNDLKTLEVGQKQLEAMAKQEHEAAKNIFNWALEEQLLRKELARKQNLYDSVIERLREINLVKGYGAFVIEELAPPELGKKIAPVPSLAMMLGGVFGLVLGAALAGAKELTDPLFRDPQEVSSMLGLPILTQIPKLGFEGKSAAAAVKVGSKLPATLTTYHRPRSRAAEAMRGFRTAVLFRLTDGKAKVIQMTSPKPLDGKSTASANLSISIAQAGQRVLLVDCDMRHPAVHRNFAVAPTAGLAEVLNGKVELDDAICETEVPNLFVLPCGPLPGNPAELLMSPQFDQLLEVLRERFDRIVLDTPPLLAVADAAIVATKADGVVLLVRLAKDSRLEVARSKELIEAGHGNLLGLAINAFDVKPNGELTAYGYGSAGFGYETASEDLPHDVGRRVALNESIATLDHTASSLNGAKAHS